MDPLSAGYIGLGIMCLLIILGMPIAFATALIGIVGIAELKGWATAFDIAGYLPHGIVAHYSLTVIPLFIIMGYFAFYAGLTSKVFHAARHWFGHMPGGLAIATIYASAGFAACTGSSVASAAVMARMAIPEMLTYNYDRKLATGVVAAGGTIAVLIPPSVPMVIYGIITEQSVGLLLIAGILPGILSAVLFALMVQSRVKLNPSLAPSLPAASMKSRFLSLKDNWGILLILVLIIGGIYTGIFTPTEAGGAGATATFLMALLSKKLNWGNFKSSLLESGRSTVMIFSVIVGILIFIRFLALSGVPVALSKTVLSLPVHPMAIMAGILAIFVFLGMFLDVIGMMLLVIPIIFPVIVGLGFDPIWFGVIVVKMGEICLITPPVGLNVYVVNSVTPGIPLQDIFAGIMPFLLTEFVTLVILVSFPAISLFLPSLMSG